LAIIFNNKYRTKKSLMNKSYQIVFPKWVIMFTITLYIYDYHTVICKLEDKRYINILIETAVIEWINVHNDVYIMGEIIFNVGNRMIIRYLAMATTWRSEYTKLYVRGWIMFLRIMSFLCSQIFILVINYCPSHVPSTCKWLIALYLLIQMYVSDFKNSR